MEYYAFQDPMFPDDWQVEARHNGDNGRERRESYIAIFTGSSAKERAQEYAAWKNAVRSNPVLQTANR